MFRQCVVREQHVIASRPRLKFPGHDDVVPLIHDVDTLFGALVPFADGDTAVIGRPKDLSFFQVLNANVSQRKVVRPTHLRWSKGQAAVIVLSHRGVCEGSLQMCVNTEEMAIIDLAQMCDILLFPSLLHWPTSDTAATKVILPPVVVDAIKTSSTMLPGCLAICDGAGDEDVDDSHIEPPAIETEAMWSHEYSLSSAERLVRILVEGKVFVDSDNRLSLFDIFDHVSLSNSTLEVLVEHGVLHLETDPDIGDTVVSLDPSKVRWEAVLATGAPSSVVAVPMLADASISKLDTALELIRQGWSFVDVPEEPYRPGGDRIFCGSVARRPHLYFASLLQASLIFAKGAPQIIHDGTQGYYKALMVLRDLVSLHARPDFNTLSHWHFLRLAAGLSVPLGGAALGDGDAPPLALEDGDLGDDVVESAVGFSIAQLTEGADAILHGGFCNYRGKIVRFDNFTHASGIQRGYISCSRSKSTHPNHHRACYRYTQVCNFPNHLHVAAYLMAWDAGGCTCPSREDHQNFEPPAHVVTRVYNTMVEHGMSTEAI